MTKIAINGFGRIGRLFFREALNNPDLEIVAVNDLGNIDNLFYLLRYDTVYRYFSKSVSINGTDLVVDGKTVKFLSEKDPANLPWGAMGVDIVVESTGVFESFESASAHLKAGAKRVVITAPGKDSEGGFGKTVLLGVNEDDAKDVKVTSNGSCTTNAIASVIKVLSETVGVEKACLNTTHAYTNTQTIVDSPTKGKDFRRGRAGAQNVAPSSTGAAVAVTRVIPELAGKFDGLAIRVPNITGSLADITFIAKRNTTPEEINQILTDASNGQYKGIIAVSNDQLVSSDVIGVKIPAVIDALSTKVIDGNLVKVLSWYDNEMGYVQTLVNHVKLVSKYL